MNSPGKAIPSQHKKRILEEYAEKNGFTNIHHFSDDGHSGVNFDRPAWKELVAEAEAGNVAVVLAKDLKELGATTYRLAFI